MITKISENKKISNNKKFVSETEINDLKNQIYNILYIRYDITFPKINWITTNDEFSGPPALLFKQAFEDAVKGELIKSKTEGLDEDTIVSIGRYCYDMMRDEGYKRIPEEVFRDNFNKLLSNLFYKKYGKFEIKEYIVGQPIHLW